MPTLTQLKYIAYYLTKEIVLFASSTQECKYEPDFLKVDERERARER